MIFEKIGEIFEKRPSFSKGGGEVFGKCPSSIQLVPEEFFEGLFISSGFRVVVRGEAPNPTRNPEEKRPSKNSSRPLAPKVFIGQPCAAAKCPAQRLG